MLLTVLSILLCFSSLNYQDNIKPEDYWVPIYNKKMHLKSKASDLFQLRLYYADKGIIYIRQTKGRN